jgi:hypothetical protein
VWGVWEVRSSFLFVGFVLWLYSSLVLSLYLRLVLPLGLFPSPPQVPFPAVVLPQRF